MKKDMLITKISWEPPFLNLIAVRKHYLYRNSQKHILLNTKNDNIFATTCNQISLPSSCLLRHQNKLKISAKFTLKTLKAAKIRRFFGFWNFERVYREPRVKKPQRVNTLFKFWAQNFKVFEKNLTVMDQRGVISRFIQPSVT